MVGVAGLRARVAPILLCGVLLAGGRHAKGADAPSGGPSEYQIKAAYLYYFSTFVSWPPEALSDGTGALVIGVLGDDPFGDALDKTMQGKTVNGRRLVVKRFDDVKAARESHILFISSSERNQISYVLGALADHPVLTVAEIDQFAVRGGQIGFRMEDRKVRFDINSDAAQRARLKLSSQLMKLGRIVHGLEQSRNWAR
jgi:hypothetical protein